MCCIRKPKLLQLFIHHIHKGFLGTCHIGCQSECCIPSRAQHRSVEQIFNGNHFIIWKSNSTAIMHITVICNFRCDFKGIRPVCHMLCCNKHSQHLRHGRRINSCMRIPVKKDISCGKINENTIRTLHFIIYRSRSICCLRRINLLFLQYLCLLLLLFQKCCHIREWSPNSWHNNLLPVIVRH